jgi:hypothetical protein
MSIAECANPTAQSRPIAGHRRGRRRGALLFRTRLARCPIVSVSLPDVCALRVSRPVEPGMSLHTGPAPDAGRCFGAPARRFVRREETAITRAF